ncbi:hypothetical protein [Roseateles violae]|uniref:Sel1 repeat family protein n=1 Tax=Roseateles violae TaxID=3058042 RepID=A0ABT8DZ62_9BURK|nr:hypothetical protein [Pelomonas sp. PFR6]MDN3922882.1 hypothetical protein [Pelomonas sp. PFR6]
MRRLRSAGPTLSLLGGLLLLAPVAAPAAEQRPAPTRLETQAIDDVLVALQHRDCKLAAARLNEGMARKYAGIYLMAGTMYEQGLCLKPDWDRAARMYLMAHEAGHDAGAQRLVAGYAAPGRDPAAALWWASKHWPQNLLPECASAKSLVDQPEAFVEALRAWPAGRLRACVYVLGVTAALAGEVEYPSKGVQFSLDGELQMSFKPAAGTIEWTPLKLEMRQMTGAMNGDAVRDRDSRWVKDSFRSYLDEVAAGVLKRYPRPEGIDPAWRVEQVYAFQLQQE